MYYKLLYRKEHLYLSGVIMLVLWNMFLIGYYFSILDNFNKQDFFVMVIFIVLILMIGLADLYGSIKSADADPIDKKLLTVVLIFLIILYFIFIFHLLSFLFLLTFLILNICFTESCIFYIHLKDIKKSKILTIIEFNEKNLKIYEDQVSILNITNKSIEKVLFEYDEVIIRGDGRRRKHRSYNITLKLGNRDYKLYYHKEKKEMIEFLLFLDEYCSNNRIPFFKVNKSGKKQKEIENLKDFFHLN